MNEGAPVMYHANGEFSPGPMYMMPGGDRQRQYQMDTLSGGERSRGGGSPGRLQGATRRWQQRRDRQHTYRTDNRAFGYDSDDSSLSSNASGSNKSADKGEGTSRERNNAGTGPAQQGNYSREWRPRRREQHTRQRRVLPDRYPNSSYSFQVKFTPDDLLNGSKWDTLSQEIWDKFVKSQQTEETFRRKMNLWKYLYVNIRNIFPRYGLYVVGSTMSGFALDSSDMDLCLYVRPLDHLEPRAHALLHLNYILTYIKSFDPADFGLAELIQAKVPILKLRDPRNGLQVDLNCNNLVGIKNTTLLNNFSKTACNSVDAGSGLARAAAGGAGQAVGARARHQRRAPPHAVLLLAHAHGHTLPAVRHESAGAAAAAAGPRAAAQPLHARRALPQHAALLRRLPVRDDGGVGARGQPRAAAAPAALEAALRRRAVRPVEHGALGVRPGDVREDRGDVPQQLPAAGGRPPPGRRLARARPMTARARRHGQTPL
ncbi:poly(A) RNA polymerase gld-2-like isoform X2 [Galleria mellonella]|uniref:Poly(A) RNA polymerase gld-2-like isoform X2 n=1 Tax=Galleria mellonella TaxID=7137 RepID=A0ABM3MA99_GALME|nr:poly(A) RNA polymerase gld-2-like isoform X2 [Galleria mellonella]